MRPRRLRRRRIPWAFSLLAASIVLTANTNSLRRARGSLAVVDTLRLAMGDRP